MRWGKSRDFWPDRTERPKMEDGGKEGNALTIRRGKKTRTREPRRPATLRRLYGGEESLAVIDINDNTGRAAESTLSHRCYTAAIVFTIRVLGSFLLNARRMTLPEEYHQSNYLLLKRTTHSGRLRRVRASLVVFVSCNH